MAVAAGDVKALRDRTGAAMMDCKAALEEAGGDLDKAVELLRVKGQASAEKRCGRATSEGTVASYIHAGGSPASWSRSSARPTSSPATTTSRSSPARSRSTSPPRRRSTSRPRRSRTRSARPSAGSSRRRPSRRASPRTCVEKIVEGQLGKWAADVVLLEQEHVRSDRYEGKTIEQLRADLAAKTGENIRIARFARFVVGEE